MNLGVFQGGISTNQVCGDAVLKLDFRFPESKTVNEIISEVQTSANNIDPSLKVKLAASGDPTFTDTNLPEVKKFLDIVKDILKSDVVIQGEEGASDSRYWAKYNIPIIMIKPDGGGIHSKDEWIDIESCLTYYNILSRYITEISR
jgi:succinyl-diaminopimelate desuccinylase